MGIQYLQGPNTHTHRIIPGLNDFSFATQQKLKELLLDDIFDSRANVF